jgi:hypothetical protein
MGWKRTREWILDHRFVHGFVSIKKKKTSGEREID